MGRPRQLHMLCLTVALFVAAPPTTAQSRLFEVYNGEWDTCKRINSSSACYRSREVYCRTVEEGKPAPWRYCLNKGMGKLATSEECDCVQDCVVSQWNAWTSCGAGEAYSARERTIVAPTLRGGKPCPALRGKKRCESNFATIHMLSRRHTWRLGVWEECTPLLPNDRGCGNGLRSRAVDCINSQGQIVNQTLCLEEEAYRRLLPPPSVGLCEIPCPCRTSVWGPWSECVANCSSSQPGGIRRRSRTILAHPTLGERCGALEEMQSCPLDPVVCLITSWETSSWLDCRCECPDDDEEACGVGTRNRYVYCIEQGADGVSYTVNTDKCNSTPKPSSVESCEVPCSIDCIVSDWHEWSVCGEDTCEQTYSSRTRSILVPQSGKGQSCPHLEEFRACPKLPCAQYVLHDLAECFVLNAPCGWGTQDRSFRCLDINGNYNDTGCVGIPRPAVTEQCYKPCPSDCVISDWEVWSGCSEPCDGVAGKQHRSRHILVEGSGNNSCVQGAVLFAERNCSVDSPCSPDVYHIEETAWGECQLVGSRKNNKVGMCEGVQNQTANCVRSGEIINATNCPIRFEPLRTLPCNTTCSKQCIFSEWLPHSDCVGSCGEGGATQVNVRRLVQGNCSTTVNENNGLQYETVQCSMPSCDLTYSWKEEEWSPCHVFPTPLSKLSQMLSNPHIRDPGALCGSGYRVKRVHCVDSTGQDAVEGNCQSELRPVSVESCIVPCHGRCILTDWNNFSVCNSSHLMTRTRNIHPFRGSLDYLTNCPELESVLQTQVQNCPLHNFDNYKRQIRSFFGRCFLDASDTCGDGVQYERYACVNRQIPSPERNASSEEFCALQKLPETTIPCHTRCDIDCQHSDWAAWSTCSTSCGQGYMTRTRSILQHPRERGRECGHLVETTTCQKSACQYIKHVYTPLSLCKLVNESLTCGDGKRVRDPLCSVNGVIQSDLSACNDHLGPSEPRVRPCYVPCDGECVVSEWSAWSECPRGCTGSQCQTRTRKVLREGTSRSECEDLIQARSCTTESPYGWQAYAWSNCTLSWMGRPEQEYCGNGVQRRIVECIKIRDNTPTYDARCERMLKPVNSRACSIPCPVDCVVSSFSEWSECERCTVVLNATRRRERKILVKPANGGQHCPRLNETDVCLELGCDEYFVERNQLDCALEGSEVCGVSQYLGLLCRRNRNYVNIEECVKAKKSNQTVHNAELLGRKLEVCNVTCPSAEECEFSNWGAWSNCLHMCDWPQFGTRDKDLRFTFRSRSLLSSWERSQNSCQPMQQDVRLCAADKINTSFSSYPCIQFNWTISEWMVDDTRAVWCDSNSTRVADEACIKSLRPIGKRHKDGRGICSCTANGECVGIFDACGCIAGYERVGADCFPIKGCSSDLHCPLPGFQCMNRTCVCADGEECEVTIPPSATSDAPTIDTIVTPNATEDSGTAQSDESPTLSTDILMIVLISCVPLLIFIVIVLLLVIITYKCRHNLEKKHKRTRTITIRHQNEHLNNQSDCSANPNYKTGGGGGVKVEEVPVAMATLHTPLRQHHSSLSSGFVDEVDPELFKCGQSYTGYSQTQSDADDNCFVTDGPYSPYPIHDYPPHSRAPVTPNQMYTMDTSFVGEESDTQYSQDIGMELGQIPPHGHARFMGDPGQLLLRSVSEEAQLTRMAGAGRQYNVMDGGQHYHDDYQGSLPRSHHRYHFSQSPSHSQPQPYHHTAHLHQSHPHQPHPHHSHGAHHYPHSSHHAHTSHTGSRDNRIMAGMDSSLIHAIEEMAAASGSSPSIASSVGSRGNTPRRSGRRRRHHAYPVGSGRGGGHRVASPIGTPQAFGCNSYQVGYHDDGSGYQSNTLPRASPSKHSSPIGAHRSPVQHVTPASPLVHQQVATPPPEPRLHHLHSLSNEHLQPQQCLLRQPSPRQHPSCLGNENRVDVPAAQVSTDEGPSSSVSSGNQLGRPSPLNSTSGSCSDDRDYDHLSDHGATKTTPTSVPPPPPHSQPKSRPPPAASSSSPPSSLSALSSGNSSLFPQELFRAIQKRASSMDNQAAPSLGNPATHKSPPAPPIRSDSTPKAAHHALPTRHVAVTTTHSQHLRNTALATTSSSSRGNPQAPPTRGASMQGQNGTPSANRQGVPPPPPPPPIRS